MRPPPGEALWATMDEVERERRVAGEVLCKNGHMPRDWRSRASMIAGSQGDLRSVKLGGVNIFLGLDPRSNDDVGCVTVQSKEEEEEVGRRRRRRRRSVKGISTRSSEKWINRMVRRALSE